MSPVYTDSMKEVTLETDRLLLRFPRESDFEGYAKICADPEVMRFLGGQPMTELEAWRHMAFTIGHWYFRGYGQWVVEEKASGRLVGRRSEEHTSELQSQSNLVCRLLLEKKK